MTGVKKNFIFPILTIIAVLVIVVVFIIHPNLTKITTISQAIITERIDLENKLSFGINLNKVQRDLEDTAGLEKELEQIYIKKGQELDFITRLENLAEIDGVNVNIDYADFSGKTISQNIRAIPLTINFSGDYKNIVNFFQSLETLKNYYNLDLIVLAKNQQNNLNAQTVGQTYLIE